MIFTSAILSAIVATITNRSFISQMEHEAARHLRCYSYCWSYSQADVGDYTVVEVEENKAARHLR